MNTDLFCVMGHEIRADPFMVHMSTSASLYMVMYNNSPLFLVWSLSYQIQLGLLSNSNFVVLNGSKHGPHQHAQTRAYSPYRPILSNHHKRDYIVIGANGTPPNAKTPSLHVKSIASTGTAAAGIVTAANLGATATKLNVS